MQDRRTKPHRAQRGLAMLLAAAALGAPLGTARAQEPTPEPTPEPEPTHEPGVFEENLDPTWNEGMDRVTDTTPEDPLVDGVVDRNVDRFVKDPGKKTLDPGTESVQDIADPDNLLGEVPPPPTDGWADQPPPLPPQPGLPSPGCRPIPAEEGVFEEHLAPALIDARTSNEVRPPQYRLTVDPHLPCRVYRIAPGDARRVERSVDLGNTWETIFFSDAESSAGHAFQADWLHVPAPDLLYIVEDGQGTALVRSDDAGATWQQANNGLEGQRVHRVAFAPSDPSTVYALVRVCEGPGPRVAACDVIVSGLLADDPGVVAMFVSRDGGGSWTRTGAGLGGAEAVPTSRAEVTVSPADPGRVFVSLNSAAGSQILAFDDYGSVLLHRQPIGSPIQNLAAVGSEASGVRIYAMSGATVRYSDDDGASWSSTGPMFHRYENEGWTFALDGTILNHGGFYASESASGDYRALYSRDGFRTLELTDKITPHGGFGTDVAWHRAQQDAAGNWYLPFGVNCRVARANDRYRNRCDPGARYDEGREGSIWRVVRWTPPAAPASQVVPERGEGREQPSGPCHSAVDCDLSVLSSCTVGGLPSGGRESDDSTNLTFDGYDLLFSRRGEVGPRPFQAVIHRVDPRTCAHRGRLLIDFSTREYREVVEATRFTVPRLSRDEANGEATIRMGVPEIAALTYDPVQDRLFFALAPNEGDRTKYSADQRTGVFSVRLSDPDAAGNRETLGAARLHGTIAFCKEDFRTGPQLQAFSYDRYQQKLWSCDGGRIVLFDPDARPPDGAAGPALRHSSMRLQSVPKIGGEVSPDLAMVQSHNPCHIRDEFIGWYNPAAFQIVDDGIALRGYDESTLRQDLRTCEWLVEWNWPSEQQQQQADAVGPAPTMACDGATFGPGGKSPGLVEVPPAAGQGAGPPPRLAAPQTVMWQRLGSELTAVRLPGTGRDWCALESTLTLVSVPQSVVEGDEYEVCARLAIDGPDSGAAGATLQFALDGNLEGEAVTGRDGTACLRVPEAPMPGEWNLQVAFLGSSAYRAAATATRLLVLPRDFVELPPPLPPVEPPPAVELVTVTVPAPAPAPVPAPLPATSEIVIVRQQAALPQPPSAQVQSAPNMPPTQQQPVQQSQGQPQGQQAPQSQTSTAAAMEQEEQLQLALALAEQTALETEGETTYQMSAVRVATTPVSLERAAATTSFAAVFGGLAMGLHALRAKARATAYTSARRRAAGRRR